jgi:tRNA pseudouridine55 synthase
MPGYILINKPIGPTSHDIVDRVRRLTGVKTVGHAGTLDPFASGLLIVGVGREATREFVKLVGLDKRYRATLRLGATSDTDDRTGRITSNEQWTMNNEQLHRNDFNKICPLSIVHSSLKTFTGKIQQLPPVYSAKKIKGKKMYQLAREGKTFERQPVEVEIYSIDLVEVAPRPNLTLTIDVHCSSGTYIRALARDIGEALGCGAYLEALERTAIGPFALEESIKIEDLNIDNWEKYLISPSKALDRCQPH